MIEHKCQCGCGQPTRLAPVNDKSKGWIKGQPLKFIKGHNANTLSGPGAKCPRWNGGRQIKDGYVVIYDHELGRKYEHIAVVERAIGRRLKNFGNGNPRTEVVHHINKNKSDNSPNNLLLCTHQYHTALHHRLEASPAWPEFQPITRNGFGGNHERP